MPKTTTYLINITPFNLIMLGIEGVNLIKKVAHLNDSYIKNKKLDFDILYKSFIQITENIKFNKKDKIYIGLPAFSTLHSIININEDISQSEIEYLYEWMADFFLVSPPKAFNYYINKKKLISGTHLEFFFIRKIILNNIIKIAKDLNIPLLGIYSLYQKIIEKLLNNFVDESNNFILVISHEYYVELILWYNNKIDKIKTYQYKEPEKFFEHLYEEILNLETNINLLDFIVLTGIIPNMENNILKIKTNFGLNVNYISYSDLNCEFSNYLEDKIPEDKREIFTNTLFIMD